MKNKGRGDGYGYGNGTGYGYGDGDGYGYGDGDGYGDGKKDVSANVIISDVESLRIYHECICYEP